MSTKSLLLALALSPAVVLAQVQSQSRTEGSSSQQVRTGRVVGVVRDSAGQPVANAQVQVVGTRLGGMSGADGRFRIGNVPAGVHTLRVQRIGEREKLVPNVSVVAESDVAVDVSLERAVAKLGGVVVSASRRAEKITDAPATITAIGTEALDQTVGNSFAAALKEAKGVDFIQVGMTSIAINARGFNSSFNNRFLMVEDGRISVLPENGLPVGQFTITPKVDLAGLEVLIGPGSALYGPDASSGVLSLRTKDPREFQGTTLEVTGGNRSYADVQGRFATMVGEKLGFKISGEYQRADDWSNSLFYNAAGGVVDPRTATPAALAAAVREDTLKGGNGVNWDARVARASGAAVYYMGPNRLEVNGGFSRTDGVGQTNVGRNQLAGWLYNVQQARFTTPHWYVNAYRAQSKSGSSFALNRYAGAQLTPANANLSADSLRMLSDWPSDGRMYAAEVQGNYTVPMALNTTAIFGAQYRDDVVSSNRQWLTDRNTGEDVKNSQLGVYAQTTTPVVRWLDVVLAGRLDDPSAFDRQWSPKAGIVVKPIADQALRVTFNRAYKSPTILQTNFFIPDWTSVIAIFGNTGGFTTQNAAGGTVRTFAPMSPESNRTWEYGYKGIIRDRLFLDATYFSSKYENFMSPLTIVGNPFASAAAGGPTYAVPTANPGGTVPVNAQGRIVNQAGVTPIVLTYYNLGRAEVSGVDVGATVLVTDRMELRGTVSTVTLDSVDVVGEATSLNSPSTKWTVGATARNVGPVTAGVTWRNVVGYYFRSGVNSGIIPTFGTLDANVSLRVPGVQNALLNVGVSNLLSCTAEKVSYRTPVVTAPAVARPNSVINGQERGCGFNRKHREMINMPEIGTMAFVGLRLQR